MGFDFGRLMNDVSPNAVRVKSPGRINLIGEHTDYNDGFVLPAAINKAIYVVVTKRNDRQVQVISNEYNETCTMDLDNLKISEFQWANYIFGIVHQLLVSNYQLSGFKLLLDGDIPIGAGMSSSAAVECAAIYALNELFGLNMTRLEMAKYAQLAEHNFAGVRCGIMDMYASLFGKKGHCIQLDCKTLESIYIPFHAEEYSILMMDTKVKHSLANSAYNQRRDECEEGVRLVQKKYPQIESLRDVTIEMLDDTVKDNKLIYKRCKYVIEENIRLLSGITYLAKGDIIAFGKKLFETHRGLSKEYEVSCVEMDFLVDQASDNPYIAGSRMMGGGFGGCTINIIKTAAMDDFIVHTQTAYYAQFGSYPTPIVVEIEEGTVLL